MKSGIRCLLAAAIMVSANPSMLRAEVTTGAEEAFFGEIPTVMSTGGAIFFPVELEPRLSRCFL
jgi:hypothetical protein